MQALFWRPIVSANAPKSMSGGPANRRPGIPADVSFGALVGVRALREVGRPALAPCPENSAIAAPEGLLTKNRGTPECLDDFFFWSALGREPDRYSDPGRSPRGGRVRGASARRALETDRGDGTSPANWFSPAFAGADFWGPGREALPADQSAPVGAAPAATSRPRGPHFLFFLAASANSGLLGYPQPLFG